MALILISVLLSAICGCVAWLAIGDRMPPGSAEKWPVMQNIASYALIVLPVIYLCIFFTF